MLHKRRTIRHFPVGTYPRRQRLDLPIVDMFYWEALAIHWPHPRVPHGLGMRLAAHLEPLGPTQPGNEASCTLASLPGPTRPTMLEIFNCKVRMQQMNLKCKFPHLKRNWWKKNPGQLYDTYKHHTYTIHTTYFMHINTQAYQTHYIYTHNVYTHYTHILQPPPQHTHTHTLHTCNLTSYNCASVFSSTDVAVPVSRICIWN